ncbi:ArdC-like ssDNA-binding domain-containing protein [Nesterenkonia lutea]|uniref:Antirestriction protein ArdC n=1 Tax=Nesterenkonia lutea TaxID=272919 RepID=A0ABR9JHW2_9MICC|nr:ArdC-like ssDNA-binding domain-containing protein [Nesterenkonia lutea]MBE1525518.1 antirestriction protein ArdC [Nesterenkonia lutea]
MAKKFKNTKTPEQRKTEAAELHAQIAAGVESLTDSQQWEKYLSYCRAFHSYSISNILLIMAQMPEASRVAGFRRWQELGRCVSRGEKGIRILGYAKKKIEEETEQGETEERYVEYFPPLSVFDISQTEIIDEDKANAGVIVHRLEGEDAGGIAGAVEDWLTDEGWTVTTEAIGGETNGMTSAALRKVMISEKLSPAQRAKTMIHEAAHVVLHTDEDPREYVEHRGQKETEAESVAYVVAGMFGLDTSSYTIGYIAGWAQGDTEIIRSTAAHVLKASHIIYEALTETAEQVEAIA